MRFVEIAGIVTAASGAVVFMFTNFATQRDVVRIEEDLKDLQKRVDDLNRLQSPIRWHDNAPPLGNTGPGKSAPAGGVVEVNQHYTPSGYVGDIGDLSMSAGESGAVQFTYVTEGKEPHEWDWKYLDNQQLNPRPAQFAGVMWLSPPNDFGRQPDCGYDFRQIRGRVSWEARAVGTPVEVEFLIGGVTWFWKKNDSGDWVRSPSPYGDSMPRYGLGIRYLNEGWQAYEVDLSNLPEEYFRRVVGGFGWVASWSTNGVDPDPTGMQAMQVKRLVFEVRNIRYHDR